MKMLRFLAIFTFLAGTSGVLSAQDSGRDQRQMQQEEAEDLFKKWLNQDVVYIITDEERGVFEKLTTGEEKDRFIEQFWQRRDSDLNTAVNEYREEHYRRIAYANREFGSGIPGWKTDRGRIYIMFGPPTETEYHSGGGTYVRPSHEGGGRTNTYPFVKWRYRNIPGVGDDVELEFVDRSWTGEFKLALYPWEKDMLMQVDGLGETNSERLGLTPRNYRPGLHPGNLNNQTYMSRFMGARFKDRPFERLGQYFALQRPPQIKQKELQQLVETQVGYSNLPFSVQMNHVWINEVSALVPVTLEVPNRRLQYRQSGSSFKARVGIYGRITSLAGTVVHEFEDVVASEYRLEHLPVGRQQKSLYQKTFLMEPGRYKVELVVKDLNSGDIGTAARSIFVPFPDKSRIIAGPIILAQQLEPLKEFSEKPESFVIGNVRVVPKMDQKFKSSDDLGVYLQVYNPTLDSSTLVPAVSIEYSIVNGRDVLSEINDLSGSSIEYAAEDRLVLVKKLKLDMLDQGHYKLVVTVKDEISGQSVYSSADFEVL